MFSRRRSYLRAALLASAAPLAIAPFVPGDPYRKNVILDVRQTGADGGVNNDFTDSSASAHAVTANGSATQGSFSPFQPTGWNNYFDGSSSIQVTSHADLNMDSDDFTIECYVRFAEAPGTSEATFSKRPNSSSASGILVYYYFGGLTPHLLVSVGGSWVINFPSSIAFTLNKWHHLAVERSGTVFTIYIDGVSGGTGSNAGAVQTNTNAFSIGAMGADASGPTPPGSQISDFRIVKGSTVYGGEFTPPTGPLTAVTNTVLLTCQNHRFVDNGGSDHAINLLGTPAVIPGSPYGQTVAYNPSTHGGSYYQDGTGDYLSIPDHADWHIGTNEFCVEGWIYEISEGSAYTALVSQFGNGGTDSILFLKQGLEVGFYVTGGGNAKNESMSSWQSNAWNHFAVSRDDSNNLRFFINGTQLGSPTTYATGIGDGTASLCVGSRSDGNTTTQGVAFFSDIRFVNGSAVRTTDFTPPTAPLTAITDTKLLLPCNGAAIYDASCKSNAVLFGDAQLDTGQTKLDDSSLIGDGTGDYAKFVGSSTDQQALGKADFTIEFWLRLNSTSGTPLFFDIRDTTGGAIVPVIYYTGGNLTLWVNSVDRISGGSLSTGTWYHVAVCRHDGTTRMFRDGVQVGSDYTDSNDYIAPTTGINLLGTAGGNNASANIEGLRVTKAVARYIGTFAAPTAEHPEIHGYSVDAEQTTDAYWNKVALLLKTLSSDGLDNNAFTDNSSSAHTVSTPGSNQVTQGSFSPYQPNGWGVVFDGTGDQLTTTAGADWDFSTGDFTAECWFKASDVTGNCSILANGGGGTENWLVWIAAGELRFVTYISSSPNTRITGPTIEVDALHHVAVSREGNDFKLWLDGIQVGSTWTDVDPQGTSSNFGVVGSQSGVNYFSGRIYDARFVKGTAVYTAEFTPPTTALTDIANTVLLTCNANRFVDSSSENQTITVGGDPQVISGSPYLSSTAYSPATHGGSLYVDGSGDELTIPNDADFQFGTGDFCIEYWYYGEWDSGTHIAMDPGASAEWCLVSDGSSLYVQSDNSVSNVTSHAIPAKNAWTHVCWSREGGDNRLFFNGVIEATVTNSNNYAGTTQITIMGDSQTSEGAPTGYMADLRIVKGDAVRTAAFTPPTSPLTAITNTVLLMPMNDAGIYDASCHGNFYLRSSTQTDTGEFKFGPSSALLGGTGDYIGLRDQGPTPCVIGTQDFCIEGWINTDSVSGFQHFYDFRPASTDGDYVTLRLDDDTLEFIEGGTVRASYSGLTTGTWYYITASRKNDTLRLFVNGAVVDGYVETTDFLCPSNRPLIGGSGYHETTLGFDGSIEDFRLTIGEARYTADFKTPTSSLPINGA